MKKLVTLFLVLALAGAMTTTAMAAPDSPTGSGGSSQTEERVLITAEAAYGGQIKSTNDGTEPVFDPEYPYQSSYQNALKGSTIIIKAKADEGYRFVCWLNTDTNGIYSTYEMITITAEEALNVKAVFELDVEKVLIKANTEGMGQIAGSDDGSEPELSDEFPMQSLYYNTPVGTTIKMKAKAYEGYKFMCWVDMNKLNIYSMEDTIEIEAAEALDLVAFFDVDAERFQVMVNTEGLGEIAYTDDGTEPGFEENPYQSLALSVIDGNTINLKARAGEGYKFLFWFDEEKQEILSMEELFSIQITGAMKIKAYFDLDVQRVLIKANTEGMGQIEMSDDGSAPVFDDEYPMQSIYANTPVGDTIILGAKAAEGWKFKEWKNEETGKTYSTDAVIQVAAKTPLDLTAVFVEDKKENETSDNKNTNNNSNSNNANTNNSNNTSTSTSTTTNTNTSSNSNTNINSSNTQNNSAVPATGDTSAVAVLAAAVIGTLGAAVILGKKRKTD